MPPKRQIQVRFLSRGPQHLPHLDLPSLLADIRACRVCEAHLPLGPRPIVQASATARLLIVGQAPGTKVHQSGIPWNDNSGETLRRWLQIDADVFYDANRIAIMPMGYCYPGKGASGDLPPREECATLWHERLLQHMPQVELTLLIGRYAQNYFLGAAAQSGVTQTVSRFAEFGPHYLPLPHPSPRNTAWFKHNPWFEDDVLPMLRARVWQVLAKPSASARE